jgi:hypothetical protein
MLRGSQRLEIEEMTFTHLGYGNNSRQNGHHPSASVRHDGEDEFTFPVGLRPHGSRSSIGHDASKLALWLLRPVD